MAKAKPRATFFDGFEFPDYEFRQFPQQMLKGTPENFQTRIAENEEEFESLKKAGWVTTLSQLAKLPGDKKVTV